MEFSDEMASWQRRIANSPAGIKRRLATFDALRIKPGHVILEAGCGGGLLIREIALATGACGRAVGLDRSEDQLAAARSECRELPNVDLVQADVADMPFDDNQFDGFAAVNTMEYVGSVDRALAEVHRVMKTGGTAAIVSVLWDHWRFHGADPALDNRIMDAWRAHCPHQLLPIELPERMKRAGFTGMRREPVTVFNGTLHENTYAFWAAKVVAAFATTRNISKEQSQKWLDQLRAADQAGRFGFVSVSILTTAIKMPD